MPKIFYEYQKQAQKITNLMLLLKYKVKKLKMFVPVLAFKGVLRFILLLFQVNKYV